MREMNLGTLIGPVVVYGGALGNLAALAALLRDATRAVTGGRRVISVGDLIGPCANSADCIAAARAFGGPVVSGDLERALAAGERPQMHGAGDWWSGVAASVDGAARDWLEALPDVAVFAHEGKRYAVVHGGFTDVARLIGPDAPEGVFRQEVTAIEAAVGPVSGVICGHLGVAFVRQVAGVAWINVGAIGVPPNDGRRGGRYVVISADGARIMRLSYDPTPAFTAMVRAGLTQGWDVALMTGRWPDVGGLPKAMCGGM